MDSTVPHKAQLVPGTDWLPGSAGRASPCFGDSPLGSKPVMAPTPITPAISTETAGPAISGSIRIYPDSERACFSKFLSPPLGVQSPCQDETFKLTQRVIEKYGMPNMLDTSPVSDAFRQPKKIKLMGKEFPCRPWATRRQDPRLAGVRPFRACTSSAPACGAQPPCRTPCGYVARA